MAYKCTNKGMKGGAKNLKLIYLMKSDKGFKNRQMTNLTKGTLLFSSTVNTGIFRQTSEKLSFPYENEESDKGHLIVLFTS